MYVSMWYATQIWIMKLYCVGNKTAFCMMIYNKYIYLKFSKTLKCHNC